MSFEEAVTRCSALADALKPGLQALKTADAAHISCTNPRCLAGSVDVDLTLSAALPNDPRWDYVIGIKQKNAAETVIWIEVHPASSTGEVEKILAKLSWLKNWVSENASALGRMPREYVWVATGRVAFTSGSPQRRRLAAAGILFAGSHYQIQVQ